ncbi:malonate decarboxylase subunit epsilon [Paraburkholderia caballeronis]|uniref:Malonyl CoA-acyl carrier protein transacylase n=1 Tax=Paraburkholderia caballeronis TaxID=416943 RepID=A0A1H7UL27_9BURK|nr:malonate decarboxylase subunit epsilon [Paraburkholderia caballeronis]PXW17480.1 malonate decarboxylase epsilon subunit [Paraburkholderia caballeronis]PXW95069.1 malonate decarboxylase epsilon subunit [Paraburkholderia caballeronis]RAJ90915.1 malonate decarboxylase epsilon subunit [Paraburkholderia caballeronis]SEE17391.1 malonate decarboxylase epsilon subunit [Paraburkholderia caballeronis]SEL97017.1 malonate decarboxylase epsilon subunit [Paraburkholderia caballeronis]
MTLALVFPGQGAQNPGFLHRLPEHDAVRETLDEASSALGLDALTLDTTDALRSTVAVQVAMTIAGVAVARALASEGLNAQFYAGLSVGAYPAAVSCGAVSFSDALRMVRKRAELMESAWPSGYGLAAISGLNETQIETLAAAHADDGHGRVYVANVNAPRQIVVAGSDAALDAFSTRALKTGARKAQRLAVTVPSHCKLLDDAAEQLIAGSKDMPFHAPRGVYVDNRGGRPLRTGDAIRDDLATNMRHTVRWFDALTLMVESDATVFVEAPPGEVLTDITRDHYPDVTALAAASLAPDRLASIVKRRLGDGA